MSWERIIDVNLNRLDESLKFIEDIIRFYLENNLLLTKTRNLRNDFLKIKKALPLTEIISFRESQHDLGRHAEFDIKDKKSFPELITANLSRAKESARIIEEFSKFKIGITSAKIKSIRFQIYDLEKAINNCLARKFIPRFYAIIDEKYLGHSGLKQMINALENCGVTMIQLRIKTLEDKEFYRAAVKIKKLIRNPALKFIINDRVDIALACRADGVHLGQDDIPVTKARALLGDGYIIGASVSNIIEVRRAETEGADYLGVGAIFKTKTKPDARTCGLSTLMSICKKSTIPVIAIGGITSQNYRTVFRTGAAGIAVSAYLFEGDLKKNIRTLTGGKSLLQ